MTSPAVCLRMQWIDLESTIYFATCKLHVHFNEEQTQILIFSRRPTNYRHIVIRYVYENETTVAQTKDLQNEKSEMQIEIWYRQCDMCVTASADIYL